MKHIQLTALLFLLITIGLSSCNQTAKQSEKETIVKPAIDSNDYLLRVYDTDDEAIGYGYVNQKGDTVIPLGKYGMCFTDTFRTYAVVWIDDSGYVAIDRNETILYQVFPFDNGPDYAVEGLFRILANKKIGYADEATGKIVIEPKYDCAGLFQDGVAKVSTNCKTETEGEHWTWVSKHWEYIDKTGKKVNMPE